ncbi:hypothetical protein [Weissella confusa]|uniref:hypothetical protein n=1 Tax=Weissella confusa TaxID=1583 RepID=UPI0022E74EDC|nr:hypothetical protein [Weissella confusa]
MVHCLNELTFWSKGLQLTTVGWLVGFLLTLSWVKLIASPAVRRAIRTKSSVAARLAALFVVSVSYVAMLSSYTASHYTIVVRHEVGALQASVRETN